MSQRPQNYAIPSGGFCFGVRNRCSRFIAVIVAAMTSLIFASCHSACQDEFTCPYIEPCPSSPGVYYRINTGRYLSSNATITQNTCSIALTAAVLNGSVVSVELGAESISVTGADGADFGKGAIRCNQAVLGAKIGQIVDRGCLFNVNRKSTIKLIGDNKLTIDVNENRLPVDINCTTTPAGCVLSYTMNLTM